MRLKRKKEKRKNNKKKNTKKVEGRNPKYKRI